METKKKIMDTAFALFARDGTAFSLSEIAELVGIKKASIYAHFENKEMLIRAIVEQEMEKYYFELNSENEDLKKIFFGVLDYYETSMTKLLFWKRLLLLPPHDLDAALLHKLHSHASSRYDTVMELVNDNIRAGVIKRKDSEEVCLMFFSLINGLLSSVLIYHPENVRKHYENIWSNYWISITA